MTWSVVVTTLQLKLTTVSVRKWPRKNDAESIRARQEALGLDGSVTAIDLEPFVRAQEMLTGAAVIPVSVVGPIELELGEYELREPDGALVETGRRKDSVFVPPSGMVVLRQAVN